jgi:hypothetical protein
MLRPWYSNKIPNLTVSASLMLGWKIRKFLATKKGSLDHGLVFLMTQTPNSSVLDSLGSSDPILICTPYIQTGIKSYHPYQGSGDNANKTAHKGRYRSCPKTHFNGSYQSSQKNKTQS